MSKPFARYRDRQPPTPGVFATGNSNDRKGTPIRIGDIVSNGAECDQERGLVVGIYDNAIVYLIDEEPNAPTVNDGRVGAFFFCGATDALIIGHAYQPLQEITRIEALADAKEANDGK